MEDFRFAGLDISTLYEIWELPTSIYSVNVFYYNPVTKEWVSGQSGVIYNQKATPGS